MFCSDARYQCVIMKTILKILFIAIVNVLLYIGIYKAADALAISFLTVTVGGLAWGITLYFSLVLFSILSLVSSILLAIVKTKKAGILIPIIALIVFCLFFIQDYSYRPYRVLLLYCSAALALFIPYLYFYGLARIRRVKK